MVQASSLTSVVAAIFVLRTLIVVGGLAPLVVIASPFIVGLSFSTMNLITSGYGFLSIAGTLCLTLGGRAFIAAYAPTTKHRDDAFRKGSVVLPVLAFCAFQVMLHFALVPLASALGLKLFLRMTPTIPYIDALRVAISMLVFSFTVVLRYIGPVSVVRCSAFPVVSSPLTATIRSFYTKCTSFDALVDLIAAPSDTPGVLIDSPLTATASNTKGRRYQTPPITTFFALLCSSLLLAWAAAWVLSHGSDTSNSEMFLNASWLTVFSHLLMTCFDGKSHELSPLRYNRTRLRSLLSRPQLQTYLYSTILSAFIVPLSLHFVTNSGTVENRWHLVAYSEVIVISTSFYLSMVDLMARNFLCASGFNLQKLIFEVTSEVNPSLTMEVIVKSLLFEDAGLFQSIMKPNAKLGTNLPEEEELSRNKEDSDKMAVVLTKKSPDLGLEDDVLRVLILESFGGKDPDSNTNLGASARHEHVIKTLVPGTRGLRVEPLAAPMVRGLCAYAAGLGLALQKLVGNPNNPKQPHIATPVTYEVWALPPGALACSERAIVGAARCVVHSIMSLGPAAMDWRGTELSMFVPVVLVAAFQLRCGIQAYEKDVFAKTGKVKFAAPLARVQSTCDDCALFVLKSLQSMESRTLELTIQLKDCRAWLEKLLDQSSAPGTLPVLIRENDRPLANYNKGGFALKYY